jgi:hypothetical protein
MQAVELARRYGWTDEPAMGIACLMHATVLAWQDRPEEAEPWVQRAASRDRAALWLAEITEAGGHDCWTKFGTGPTACALVHSAAWSWTNSVKVRGGRPIPTLRKHLRHCELGELELGCQTLQLPGSDLRLV